MIFAPTSDEVSAGVAELVERLVAAGQGPAPAAYLEIGNFAFRQLLSHSEDPEEFEFLRHEIKAGLLGFLIEMSLATWPGASK